MKRRFAVFHLNDERGLGGGERQLLYLAAELAGRGHWNCIVCRKSGALDAAAHAAGFERLHLPYLFEWDPVSALILRRKAASRINASGDPQRVVIHAHTAHTASISWLATAGRLCARVVHRRVVFPFSNPLSSRIKYKQADAVIAISNAVRNILTAGGIPDEKISVIRSAIPPNGFPSGLEDCRRRYREMISRQWNIPRNVPWVGSLIALTPCKDPANFVMSIPHVLKDFPSAHFILAGDGPLMPSMKRLAEDPDIGERLHFLGFRKDSLEVMAALDLFVLPSRDEGMGSVLLEAMSAGVPIAATDAGGIPDVVENGVCGLLVRPGDPRALARAQAGLLSDPGLRERFRAAGFKRIKLFSTRDMASLTEKVYARVCDEYPAHH